MRLTLLLIALLLIGFQFNSNAQEDTTLTRLLHELDNHPKEDTIKVDLLIDIGFQYLAGIDIDTVLASQYAKKSLDLSKKISYVSGTAGAYNLFGIIENFKGSYDTSIEYYLKSIKLFDSIGEQQSAARITHNIGIACDEQKKFDKSLEYSKDALSRYEAIQDTLGIIKTYNSIGGLLNRDHFNQTSKAQEYFKNAIELCYLIGEKENLGYCQLNYVSTLDPYTQSDEIVKSYESAIESFEAIGDDYIQFVASFNLGHHYYEVDKYTASINQQKHSLFLAENIQRENLIIASHEALYMAYEQSEDYEKALSHFKKFDSLNSVVLNAETEKNIADIEIKYETEKKEQENTILKRDNTIQKQKATLNQRMFWGILIFSAILFLALLLWFLKYRQKRQSLEREKALQMEQLNQQIDILQASVNSRTEEPQMVTPPKIPLDKINHLLSSPLSEREFEVLNELAKGFTNQQIADNLFVSINTVKTHLLKIYTKLDVKNRVQAVKKISIG